MSDYTKEQCVIKSDYASNSLYFKHLCRVKTSTETSQNRALPLFYGTKQNNCRYKFSTKFSSKNLISL